MTQRDKIDPAKPYYSPPKKFSVTRTIPGTVFGRRGSDEVHHYLIEARDREEAERILEEELRPSRSTKDHETIEWSTHETPAWRIAWRHEEVEVLHPTKIPDGIQ